MKKAVFAFLILVYSCTTKNNSYTEAANALDAGREFIGACLKGDFARAYFYMVDDAENKKYLDKAEAVYRNNDRDAREQYREASINIGEVADVTEKETIINYSNSYDKVAHKIKVLQKDNKWRVDFKYTFNPNL